LRIPEVRKFIDATGWEPGSFVVEEVYKAMCGGIDPLKLKAAFIEWNLRGYNPKNVQGYLEWARDGIPPARKTQPAKMVKDEFDASLRRAVETYQEIT
jgi:hypothetical protein